MPTDEKTHELLTEAAARLVYVDENTTDVDLEGVVEGIEDAQTKLMLARRDAVTDEVAEAVGRDE
jgi:hypothetical protein